MKQFTKEQIQKAEKILRRGVEILVESHQYNKSLKPSELELLESMSDTMLMMGTTFDDTLEEQIINGLQYIYDDTFKGDEDFRPTNEKALKILGL